MTTYADTFLDLHSELVKGVPTFEVLDPADVADHIRAGDDPVIRKLISDYLDAAREWVENEVQLSLPTRTLTLYLDEFPCDEIEIRFPPLQSVTSIYYLDYAGTSTLLSSTLYRVDAAGKPARIIPAYGQVWPDTYAVTNAITITMTVGYTESSLVPPCAKQAMRFLAAMMFNGNGSLCEGELEAVRRMLDSIRWGGYA